MQIHAPRKKQSKAAPEMAPAVITEPTIDDPQGMTAEATVPRPSLNRRTFHLWIVASVVMLWLGIFLVGMSSATSGSGAKLECSPPISTAVEK